MKLPQLFSTNRPRSFHYTPLFDKDGESPIVKQVQVRGEEKYKFKRTTRGNGLFVSNMLKLIVPAAILAAIVYFCLIIVGN